MPSATANKHVPHAPFCGQAARRRPGTGPIGIDADDDARLFGERQRHAAAAAAGVEHAAANGHAGALEERDHLGAAVYALNSA